ncbi:type I-F CRISPR-associated protein Csy3 [uncultured Desulfuromonas sp.]|uniref:type I-F CRISPR-associated protein Csy3 n=1 Tax=uncultured Desulfuromonas sp. TaxID=181013 RepID=UPI002AAB5A7A|nr:type I-F CRISPR-associated protein Csy3 [uncultured Desulfuromonas sp.]
MANLQTASVLAFDRRLNPSDALMFSGNWGNRNKAELWQAITIEQKDVRGTISNRMKATIGNDPAKLDAEIQKANLQRVDVAALPFDADTLKVSFTLRIISGLIPSSCNNPEYQQALAEKISTYTELQGFKELANRYAENIANGRFLWRNRVGAEAIEIVVSHKEQTWRFDCENFSLRNFSASTGDLAALSQVIEQGLSGDGFAFVRVDAFVRLGQGQEVFPSQELILDKGKSDKSKVLYKVQNTAAIHSQKIGNALRTIDTWYPEADEIGPIAVEPYGSVTNRGKAYRQPKDKMDFYNLLDNWIIKDKAPDVEQQHYVIATLIRGGVFGKAD